MTTAYLGSLSVGGAVPGADAAIVAGIAGINAALPDLEARLAALQAFAPVSISFASQISLAQSIATNIQAAVTAGLVAPDLAAQIAIIAAQIADIIAQLASIQLNLDVLTNLQAPLAAAGAHGYAFDGTVSAFGAELDAAIGVTPGVSGSAHANALVLLTTIGATWAAMGQILKVVP